MKNIALLVTLLIFVSCGNEKIIQLPEINHSDITEILDVSPAYLFYDETKLDGVELNRKNLIVTTNWLVNVDKRLTLKQVIPQIKFLQDKKANSSHKNETAKNYFTCNNTSIKNLGFIEFTNVVYNNQDSNINQKDNYQITVIDLKDITIFLNDLNYKTDITTFVGTFKKQFFQNEVNRTINLSFNNKLSFQDYMTFKSTLTELDIKNVTISNNEFIFN